jgi:hypothetical protein
MRQPARSTLRKPAHRTLPTHADLHGSEVGGGTAKGAFQRFAEIGNFDNCCQVTQESVDGSQIHFASTGQIAELGVFGKFESVLNNFFGGQFMTVDELKVASGALGKGAPDVNIVGFSSNDGREQHQTIVEFGHTRPIDFGGGNNGVIEQVFTDIGRGVNEEVLALFFSGDKPTRIVIETFFANNDGGAQRDAYQAKVEPVLREIAASMGFATNEIFSQ